MNDRSSDLNELAAALCAAQAEFEAVPKDSVNPFFKSKYASLAAAEQAARPILSKHGLAISQFPGTDEAGDTLTTWLLHRSGQFIVESMRLHLAEKRDKGGERLPPTAQEQGSATTYARRYAFMAVLGLVPEDDDGNAATRPAAAREAPATHMLAGAERFVTGADIEEMKRTAAGLSPDQIRFAFQTCGIEGHQWSRVPKGKAALLTEALAEQRSAA